MGKEELYYDRVTEFEFKPEVEAQKLLDIGKKETAELLAHSTGRSVKYWLERIKVVTIELGLLVKDEEGIIAEPAPSEVYTVVRKTTLPKEAKKEFEDLSCERRGR